MAQQKARKNSSQAGSERQNLQKDLRWDSVFSSLGRIEIVLLIGGVLLLMVLIYTIQDILSPFLVLGSILFILYPLRSYVLARNLMWLAIILFTLWFLDAISMILVPFIISLLFAYILNPVVDLFHGWKIPRWVSSLILILLFITGITLVLFFIIPIALTQLEGMLDLFSKLTNDFQTKFWNSRQIKVLESYGVSVKELHDAFANQLTPRFEDILKAMINALGSLRISITEFITQVFYIILIPFLTFYFLTDFPKINQRFLKLIPRRNRDRIAVFITRADDLIGHYLRGVLLVAFLEGIIISIVFSIFGIKYAFLLGLLACIFDLVPYFGLIAIMGLSAIVALFSDPPVLQKLAIAVVSISILHMAEVVFLSPKIIGSKVGMHPLLIILSLLVFMYFLGFIGLLIAVPTTALVILFVRDWEERRRGEIPLPKDFFKTSR